jgi:adenylate cyclase, class 2
MAASKGKREIEIKIRLDDAGQGRRLLSRSGFRVVQRRAHEDNTVFDRADGSLRRQGKLLRLRRTGRVFLLTLKGPAASGKFKSRQEIETTIEDPGHLEAILHGLGFKRVFRYEKYRTLYQSSDPRGTVMLDETPLGVFLELEGKPSWIVATAALLGFGKDSYITITYMDLHRQQLGRRPQDLLFPKTMP